MSYTFKYTSLKSIKLALINRIEIIEETLTGTSRPISASSQKSSTSLDLIYEYAQEIEEGYMDSYLSMLYEMPLCLSEPSTVSVLNTIARDYIAGTVYENIMPAFSEDPEAGDLWGSLRKKSALSLFQSIFNGTGIFIPNVQTFGQTIQNDENRAQQANKPLILKGEILKPYIGYDNDGDGVAETDLYKRNPRKDTSILTKGDFPDIATGEFIQDGVQTRRFVNPSSLNHIQEIINFW